MPRPKKTEDAALTSRTPKRGKEEEAEDELEIIDGDADEFFDENDSNPGDRRRDPLRKP